MSPKQNQDIIDRSRAIVDKCRNEQQKSILLKELARLSYENVSNPIMQESAELQAESKKLTAKSRSLRKAS